MISNFEIFLFLLSIYLISFKIKGQKNFLRKYNLEILKFNHFQKL